MSAGSFALSRIFFCLLSPEKVHILSLRSLGEIVTLHKVDIFKTKSLKYASLYRIITNTIVFGRQTRAAPQRPVITYVGPMLAYLMTGSFVVEKIFTVPGLGREFVSSITNRDYTMIMGTTIVLATLVIVANVVVDILYKIIDPRINLK